MTHLLIECEHDMEVNIIYLTELARHKGKTKIELSFPTRFMMATFMDNLCDELEQENIFNTDMDVTVYVPQGE